MTRSFGGIYMDKDKLSREQLLAIIEKYQKRVETLKNHINVVEKEKDNMQFQLCRIKDICKTYFTSKTLSKEEFYCLYKNNVKGNLDLKV